MHYYLYPLIAMVCVPLSGAFRVDFAALDAREPVELLHRPFHVQFNSSANSVHEDETMADVLLSPWVEWEWESDSFYQGRNLTGQCHSLLQHMARQAGEFTHCLMEHSRPFRACQHCVGSYTRFTHLYHHLQEDEVCKEVLLMSDRMEVILTLYTTLSSLWRHAHCHTCFANIEENPATGQVTFNYTDQTVLFLEMEANVSSCFQNYSHALHPADNISEACSACRQDYKQMNKLFSQLNKETGQRVCMDLVDMMNSTRLMWSSHFNCPRPAVDAAVVFTITAIIVVIIIVLYPTSSIVARIRMPQIFKQKRMKPKRRRRRYGALGSDTGKFGVAPIQATETSHHFS